MLPQNKRPVDIDEYVNATSLDMALEALADGNGTMLAGGSDLWAQKDSGNGRLKSRLVNLKHVDELRGISNDKDVVRIGALTTMSEILESRLVAENVPLLAQAANRFASVQIRNVATIGGNIANASPAADMVLPLIALDGLVVLHAKGQITQKVPLADFFLAPGKTSMARNGLISAIEFAKPASGFYGGFCKSGPRPALEISKVAMCLAGTLDKGTLSNSRLVFGAVGPVPIRCRNTETLIDGSQLTDELIEKALDLMVSEISPIDDIRASKWYRTHMARTYLEQELQACRSQ